jgi:hypothetical protein
MTVPPFYHVSTLGNQAQMLSRNCDNNRIAMILQYVAVGSMIVMTGISVSQAWKDAFSPPNHRHKQGRSL